MAQQAAANAVTGPNGQQQAMTEFIGYGMPNGGHNFINMGHSSALGSIGVFGQDHFSSTQMLSRSYDGEPTARLGMNAGYEFGYSASMGGAGGPVSGLGSLGVSSFLKSGTAGGDEKPSAGQ
jgi:hypothetical protein